jgi:hypothetical protein
VIYARAVTCLLCERVRVCVSPVSGVVLYHEYEYEVVLYREYEGDVTLHA